MLLHVLPVLVFYVSIQYFKELSIPRRGGSSFVAVRAFNPLQLIVLEELSPSETGRKDNIFTFTFPNRYQNIFSNFFWPYFSNFGDTFYCTLYW